jgi:hypothetical protein
MSTDIYSSDGEQSIVFDSEHAKHARLIHDVFFGDDHETSVVQCLTCVTETGELVDFMDFELEAL